MGIGSIIGGVTGAISAISGANAINDAAQAGVQWNKDVYNTEQSQLSPWASTGQGALYSLASLLGIGGATPPGATTTAGVPTSTAAAPTAGSALSTFLPNGQPGYTAQGQFYPGTASSPTALTPTSGLPTTPSTVGGSNPISAFQAFQQTPYYQFPLQQGLQSLSQNNAAKGLYNSGATAKDILQTATGYASSGLGSYMAQLANLAQGGQSAIQSTASTGVGVSGNVLSGGLTGAGALAAGMGAANQNLFGPQGGLTPLLNSLPFNSSSYGGGGGNSPIGGSTVSGNTIMSAYG